MSLPILTLTWKFILDGKPLSPPELTLFIKLNLCALCTFLILRDLYSGKLLIYVNKLPGLRQQEKVNSFLARVSKINQGALVQLSNGYPLFRYTDTLMMKAESLLRTEATNEAAVL